MTRFPLYPGELHPKNRQCAAFPNVITRITPAYLDVINYFQAKYD